MTKRKPIPIKVLTFGHKFKTTLIPGIKVGNFLAVHRKSTERPEDWHRPQGYSVTHIPTGFSVAHQPTQQQALKLAGHLTILDWDFKTPTSRKFKAILKQVTYTTDCDGFTYIEVIA